MPMCYNSKFVLFDITANQYVRASSIPDKHGLNFGHIVLLQTCWSTDPSVTINCEEVLNRGPWAGHRLEITTIDCIDKDAKDVSEEVVNKVVGVFDQDDYTPFKWHCQSYPHILRPPPI
ncbi:hypothetical protein LPJ57_000528 [Coemansia sp. RSA 486]|nr:hypothetical protein LPJ57_000528 [Coemansia sp. RSA 486]